MRIALLAALLVSTGALAQTPGVAWTVDLDAPTTEGFARPGGLDRAPGGEVCAASTESLGGTRGRIVVRRYGPAGTELWAHPVETWFELTDAFEVAADGEACLVSSLASAVFSDDRARAVGVARVAASGVVFATRVAVTSSVRTAYVRPDGDGGAWLGLGGQSLGALVRVDASGDEVARLSRGSSGLQPPGIRALAVTPGGDAVAVSVRDPLLVVAPDGTLVTEAGDASDPDPIALALDGAGGAFLLATEGTIGQEELSVRRYTLGGTLQWSTPLGPGVGFSAEQPHTLLAVGGDAIVVWGDEQAIPQAARLSGATGDIVWTQPLGDVAGVPVELVETADGAVVRLDRGPITLLGLDLATGAVLWSEPDLGANPELRTERALAACGPGVCLQGRRSLAQDELFVEARDETGAVVWTATRAGEDIPYVQIGDAALAPDGGLYTLGVRRSGRRADGIEDALTVHRLAPTGAVAWTSAIDTGGQSDQRATYDALAVTPDGGVVAAGTASRPEGQRPVVVRLRADGSVRWTTVLDVALGRGVAEAVAATPDGGAVIAFIEGAVFNGSASQVARLGPDGDEVWRTDLGTVALGADVLPVVLASTTDGFAVAYLDLITPGEARLAVARLDADGTVTSNSSYTDDVCPPEFSSLLAGVDASGVVTAPVTGTCGELRLARYAPDGSVTSQRITPAGSVFEALSVAPSGEVVLGYGAGDVFGLARFGPDGATAWDTNLTLVGRLLAVAARRAGGALALRLAPGDDAFLAPSVFVVRGDGALSSLALPRPGGLPTNRSQPSALVSGEDDTAYVVSNGATSGIRVASISRLFGLPVASEDGPTAGGARLRIAGANPLRAGAPLRLALGEPAAVELVDALGRRLGVWELGAGTQTLALPALAPGLYLVRARFEDTSETLRVIVR